VIDPLFTPELCARLIRAVGRSATVYQAIIGCGIAPARVKLWLNAGREDPGGPYGSFARQFLQADQDLHEEQTAKLLCSEEPQITERFVARRWPGQIGKGNAIEDVFLDPRWENEGKREVLLGLIRSRHPTILEVIREAGFRLEALPTRPPSHPGESQCGPEAAASDSATP
jgi:hypothetical protein